VTESQPVEPEAEPVEASDSRWSWEGIWRGALAGVLTAAVAVGIGELMAWLIRPAASPVIAVGNRLIDFTPERVRQWAIRNFGTNDKHMLLTGIYVALALGAIVIGILAWRWLWVGVIGVAAAGGFAIYCATSARGSHGSDIVPAIVATIAAELTLVFLVGQPILNRSQPSEDQGADRRLFLVRAGWIGAGAVGLSVLGRSLQHARFNVNAARNKIVLPSVSESATASATPGASASPGAVATARDFGISGMPWQTPNKDFYRVDTALDTPQINPANWKLRIHGMVDHEIELTYAQLKSRPLIERWITLNCVSFSYGIGSGLVGNAQWLGTLLAPILTEAGIHAGADQLFCTSSDGMTIGVPAAPVMDGRDAMLAIGMNGVPLPIEHGFPVRIIVPGLYGYISACKWVVDMEVTTFAKKAYWASQGWAQDTDMVLSTRIDTPRSGKKVKAGSQVPIAGVAWDQHVGVSSVQVRFDNGTWQECELAAVPSTDTWRQWRYYWTPPKAGSYTITARAFDSQGNPQIAEFAGPLPGGGTGLHSIIVQVV
jgi:DMSO/TMAO reductase YedYZ molybdopterin-dependent catalytic subunit